MTVLIISVIALSIGVAVALLGSNELIFGLTAEQSHSLLQQADGCAEEAYLRLKKDPAYTGGSIPYADGTCTVVVTGGGSTRTVTSTLTIGNFTKSVEADVSLQANTAGNAEGIDVTAWEELK